MFVRLFVRSFVRSYFRRVEIASKFCVKVSQAVYISATTYQKAFIFGPYIVTLEGWHSLHDRGPHGPCPGVGLEVKI